MTYVDHKAASFACAGKEAYATQARAMTVIRRRQRRGKLWYRKIDGDARRELKRLSAYHCDFCHHWHVGSDHGLKAKGPR